MKQSVAIDIALACMDKEAQRLFQEWRRIGANDKSLLLERERIYEAMKIIKQLAQQGRMEI